MNKAHIASLIVLTAIFAVPSTVSAHRSGCHNLHTCPSDTDTYVCGDLGYPCNGATSLEQVDPATIFVPLATEKMFTDVFGRKPTDQESDYWKKRFRSDKNSVRKIRAAMQWHHAKNSSGPKIIVLPAAPLPKVDVVKEMNTLFASVYWRIPTASENKYWLSRIKDKPTAPALIGAMTFHKANGILH